jgi:hypothetical protein
LGVQDLLDISDPIGQSAEAFAGIAAQIADLLPSIFEVCQSGPS